MIRAARIPGLVLEGARSLIVVAVNYNSRAATLKFDRRKTA